MSDQDAARIEILPAHETLPAQGISRRDFLARSVYSTAGLYALTQYAGAAPARAQSRAGSARLVRPRAATPGSRQQLPFWSDTANWDQPEYYETLQAGRRHNGRPTALDGSVNSGFFEHGRDSLLIRGPGGLLINRFDPGTGQWMLVPNAPALTDTVTWDHPPPWIEPLSWKQPPYYSTIQSADIDGDGIAELLARDPYGLLVWKYDNTARQWNQMPGSLAISDASGWNQPQYYSTLQCANIDNLNGSAAELIGRGGAALYVWQYDTATQNWVQLAALPDLSDANGWGQPQYYSTIQCADVLSIGQMGILARGPNGVQWWTYDYSGNFDPSPSLAAWSDANGWNQPQYYSTIQLAATGLGDTVEKTPGLTLMGRGPNGMEVWKFSLGENAWVQLPFNPVMTDADGWDQPQYYSTIQFVDINGDGNQEMVARGPQGLQAWTYQQNADGSYSFVSLPDGPAWSDAAGWNQVQYYSTIQPAYSLLPGDAGYSGTAQYPQGLILARNGGYVETWAYNTAAQSWSQTSISAFPPFSGGQLAAYNYLTGYWNIQASTNGGGIRYLYDDTTLFLTNRLDDLKNGLVTAPGSVSPDDWNAVKSQLINELTWVLDAQNWYNSLVYTQLLGEFLGDALTLDTVGQYLGYSSNNNTTLVLSILSLIAGAMAAALGFPELEAGAVASIVGVASYAFSAAATALPAQGGAYQTQYSQLETQLSDSFSTAQTQLGQNVFGITGGGGTEYVAGDYGLLSAIGQMIETAAWIWPDDSSKLLAVMQRCYATEVWKVLFNAYQAFSGDPWYSVVGVIGVPGDYPTEYAIWTGPFVYNGETFYLPYWAGQKSNGLEPVPAPAGALIAQFNPPADTPFPLGVSTAEFFQAQNGWPVLSVLVYALDSSPLPPAYPPRQLPALGADLHTSVTLSRAGSGAILATVTITNRGLTAASNVEITEGRLNLRKPVFGLPTRRTHLKPGKWTVQTVTFPDLPGGARAVVRISGRYLGGTFGASFRVTLP
jgi:hypothetical protein